MRQKNALELAIHAGNFEFIFDLWLSRVKNQSPEDTAASSDDTNPSQFSDYANVYDASQLAMPESYECSTETPDEGASNQSKEEKKRNKRKAREQRKVALLQKPLQRPISWNKFICDLLYVYRNDAQYALPSFLKDSNEAEFLFREDHTGMTLIQSAIANRNLSLLK